MNLWRNRDARRFPQIHSISEKKFIFLSNKLWVTSLNLRILQHCESESQWIHRSVFHFVIFSAAWKYLKINEKTRFSNWMLNQYINLIWWNKWCRSSHEFNGKTECPSKIWRQKKTPISTIELEKCNRL